MSGARKRRFLSEEDRRLWSSVARTVRPISGRQAAQPLDAESAAPEEAPVAAWPSPPAHAPAISPRAKRTEARRPSVIDRATHRKLSKGRLGLHGTLDLHDMTQTRAYDALLGFLRHAHGSGLRHVLVITGKGTISGGVLRSAVPHWLATPPFSDLVSGYDTAGRVHGGEGAFYVRLRRHRK